MEFYRIFKAEWLKKKGSMAHWLVIAGGFFVPMVHMLTYFFYPERLLMLHQADNPFWQLVFQRSWNLMSVVFLPMGIVIAVSMLCQLEFRNNAWKQVYATPVRFSSVFFAKLMVILVMLGQLIILFNLGMVLAVMIPPLIHSSLPLPNYPIEITYFIRANVIYFLMCMPMVLLQFGLGLYFKNFVIPLGVGLVLVVLGMAAISWEYHYLIPSLYPFLHFMSSVNNGLKLYNLMNWAAGYSLLFFVFSYISYRFNPQKG